MRILDAIKSGFTFRERDFYSKFITKPSDRGFWGYFCMPIGIILYVILGFLFWNRKIELPINSEFGDGLVGIVAWIGAVIMFFMLIYDLYSYNTRKESRLVYTLLFIPLWPFYTGYVHLNKMVKTIRQDEVVGYIPMILSAAFFSVIFATRIETGVVLGIVEKTGMVAMLSEEFVVFILVVLFNLTFFGITRALLFLMLFFDYKMSRHDVTPYENFKSQWGVVKSQLKISKIVYYVIGVVLCAGTHVEDRVDSAFVNAFLAITTIAALTREVGQSAEVTKTDKES